MNDVSPPPQDGKRVLLALVSFFVVFASVDAFFVYKAISTLPGVVSENAYEIGLNYNKIIAEAKKRKLEQHEQNSRAINDVQQRSE
ncbi:MAG TPA: hypothetical protein DCM27_03100 [Rhodospirillaceae bacterium]|nr:hypothetical protein [Rhodospirillaceae bacterium]